MPYRRSGQYGSVFRSRGSYVCNAAQKLGSDFYILPSSVHETIVGPAAGFSKSEAELLKKIVMKIN